jgi:Putative mono-oxygenase ydhR
MSKVFVYAEYQVSTTFKDINWNEINSQMKKFSGLISKTWLSGKNTKTVGGFYEFDNQTNAQTYIDELLIPFAKKVGGNLTVKLFDGEIVKEASIEMNSPFYK